MATLTIVLLSYGIKTNLLSQDKLDIVKATQQLQATAERAGLTTLAAGQRERRAMYSKCKNKLVAVTYLALDYDLVTNINTWFSVSLPISALVAQS